MNPLWINEVEARIRAAATNLDPQTTPDEVIMCKRCVVTNQRPRITFDDKGICSACRYAEDQATKVDWDQREHHLRMLLDSHRRDSGYDVIVPCSGGKDSSMVAHRLKHDYDMHPLCVTWAPFIYTEVGRANFDAFVQSGFDVVVAHPNGHIHRKLARLALEYYGDPFQPFVYGQLAWPMHCAVQYGIPLVMYGENGEAEYGGDTAANNKPCWDFKDWDRVYSKGRDVEALIGLGWDINALDNDDVRNVSPFYGLPLKHRLEGAEFHWFGYYHRWHPMENFYFAEQHTGFEVHDERSGGTYSKFASLDDKLDGLHYWFAFLKFGIGRCTSDAAQQVRAGDISRDDALALVERYDGEVPERHMDEVMEYLGMDAGHLCTIVDRFNNGNAVFFNNKFENDGRGIEIT